MIEFPGLFRVSISVRAPKAVRNIHSSSRCPKIYNLATDIRYPHSFLLNINRSIFDDYEKAVG